MAKPDAVKKRKRITKWYGYDCTECGKLCRTLFGNQMCDECREVLLEGGMVALEERTWDARMRASNAAEEKRTNPAPFWPLPLRAPIRIPTGLTSHERLELKMAYCNGKIPSSVTTVKYVQPVPVSGFPGADRVELDNPCLPCDYHMVVWKDIHNPDVAHLGMLIVHPTANQRRFQATVGDTMRKHFGHVLYRDVMNLVLSFAYSDALNV